jgi:hypothetical protein
MASCQKHIRELSKVVGMIAADHDIEVSRGNHLKVVIRRGSEQRTLFSGKTPSDHRSILNFKAQLKRAYQDMDRSPREPRF